MKRVLLVAAIIVLPLAAAAAEEPAPSPDQAFEQLKSYDYSQARRPLAVLEQFIARSTGKEREKRAVAERLASVLADPQATEAAKAFVCGQLPLVASDAQVPLLAKMLDDPKTCDMARRVLAAIPGEASAEALRAALTRLRGVALVGVINSLGDRRDAKAAPALATMLADSDETVLAAAARALGKLGTADAAAALARLPGDTKARPAIVDALLQCAERRAAAGDDAAAGGIYERFWAETQPTALRAAGLAGLVKVAKEGGQKALLLALQSGDPVLQGTAAGLARETPGESVTLGLTGLLPNLDVRGQVLVIDALASRGDRAAGPAVAKMLDAKEEAVRAAAAAALAALGDATCVERLAGVAASEKGAVQQAARRSLERLSGADVDKRLLAAAGSEGAAARIELMRAMAARRTPGAAPLLMKAAADTDEQVRAAALNALGVAAQAEDYPRLLQFLVAAKSPADAAAAEKAAAAVGGRLAAPADRAGPVLAAMKTAPAAAKPALLRLLALSGGADALAAVRVHLADADKEVGDAAVRALANWPDGSAAPDLLKLAKDSNNTTYRVLALRGYLRLTRETKDDAARMQMLEQVRPIATTTDSKKLLLAALADVPDSGALAVSVSFVDDKDVRAEAAAAALKIGRTIVRTDRAAVAAAMKKLKDAAGEGAIAEQADAILQQAARPPTADGIPPVPAYDKARSDARKKELAGRAPKGYRVVCYLDCGPDTEDGAKGGPTLRMTGGTTHLWPGVPAADLRYGTIAYDSQQIVFEAAGLSPKRSYQVGFTWWDFDHNTRVQSVWAATGKGERETTVLDATRLPSGAEGQKADEKTLAVPRGLYGDGTLRVMFRNESAPNAVVSEVWMLESEAETSAPPPDAQPAAAPAAAALNPKAEKHVLIVTGLEYPGHKWRETAPALARILREDPRLDVRVVEDVNFIASPELKNYDAIVLNYMNWEKPSPGPEVLGALQKFVDGGKGLVLVHFACGAFQDWPEFRNLAGRVYDPKARPHDPFGRFRVDIAGADHPITKGLKAFETTDELYTCLTGDRPVDMLATARSKVDGKDYPMAFAFSYGKGRVFHSVLGHDVQALVNPPVAELYRRAAAWAAGLAPAAN